MSMISSLDEHQIDALREYLLSDFKAFSQFAFKIQTGTKFIHIDYHDVMFEFIQKAIDMKSNRQIINIPPRGSKTQIVSIFLPLFAWCRNPHGQTILTGFNSDVLFESSGYIRTIMSDPDFQKVFPDVIIDASKKSVERLGTMSGGVCHAVTTTGKVTGKGAGTLSEDFSGLMSIDDVIKPSDANSPTERGKINNNFGNTLTSRLATETTPLLIIMQRLHSDDLCGFLMKGGSDDIYDWLNIPGIVTKETGSQEWYDEQIDRFGYTHVRPYLYDLKRPDDAYDKNGESSFWAVRKSMDTLNGMRKKDPYTFNSQYMGMPVNKGKVTVEASDIRYYEVLDKKKIKYTFFTADTASTTQSYSDFSVVVHWALNSNDELMVVDALIGKWKVPDLIKNVREFWVKRNVFDPNAPRFKPRGLYMEDKSSGLFLNQQFLEDRTVKVIPVPRDGSAANDKFTRFLNAIPYINDGKLWLPKEHEYTNHMKRELLGQTELGNNTGHDDFVDNVSDAFSVAFGTPTLNYADWA